jgi:hypothetical protein
VFTFDSNSPVFHYDVCFAYTQIKTSCSQVLGLCSAVSSSYVETLVTEGAVRMRLTKERWLPGPYKGPALCGREVDHLLALIERGERGGDE